ncbi:uncharacterized protein LOC130449320 [Diorhabda sublineata]|uniref:uncharacterized protein LOC130449320 n=1 Tax=Diorhabda sublineata TaxID=1163346 RepID=UPI0024E0569B|nr:uncharacterized protein LOC130449320 [Diorhabda sublineata]XP_056643043.1 uncharacterized protein LOC130449320 [Diorhabda sublineata]
MIFPVEIIEKILRQCNGTTLLNARKVDEDWKCIVDRISQKTKIWECCCKEEIPNNQLLEYLQQYREDDFNKWLNIYINWTSFENLDRVVCDIILSPADVPKISCIAVSKDFIALGTEDGRLKIYTSQWKMVFFERLSAVRINSLNFIESEFNDSGIDICLLFSHQSGLKIFCYDGFSSNYLEILDVKSHSVYKNFICYERFGGRITITKLVNVSGGRELCDIWFSRIYSPTCISCMNMWEGVCTFLINNEVKVIEYGSIEGSTMDIMKKKTSISFNFPHVDSQNTQILRNDVIVSLYRSEDDVKCDLIEFFLLGEKNKCSKKLFSTWEIFKCYITYIYLYGNTLLLGMDVGIVYIYHVSRWKHFDIRDYGQKLIIGKHPIICIDVKEMQNERRYYVSSRVNIHEISGFLPNVY